MVSKCNYETMHHVFIEGNAANYIWKLFGSPLGIKYQNYPVRYMLNTWWQEKSVNDVHKLVLQITPIVIC